MGVLPGGYWDGTGRLHRAFEPAVLTGREEELLAWADAPSPAALVTEVLSRCVRRLGEISPVTPEVARGLLVADRQYLLLALRRATFGDSVRAELICPWSECGRQVSLTFSLADVPVEEARERAPLHTMALSSHGAAEVTFRLPNGADQEELSAWAARNEAEALSELLARCVLSFDGRGPQDRQAIAALPSAVRAEIEARMEELAPKIARTMETVCAECGRVIVAPFDIQRFFFGELRTDGDLLHREVHYLAYHYHWSEPEIMELTREKRRRYIEVLSDTIEVLNHGA